MVDIMNIILRTVRLNFHGAPRVPAYWQQDNVLDLHPLIQSLRHGNADGQYVVNNIIRVLTDIVLTKFRGLVDSIASFSRCPGFDSQSSHRVSRLIFFVLFPSPLR
jgi:hypothetical protein